MRFHGLYHTIKNSPANITIVAKILLPKFFSLNALPPIKTLKIIETGSQHPL
jgi:hypothetical protein